MPFTTIDGAAFFEGPAEARVRRLTLQSADGRFLGVVSEGRDRLYRVQLYERTRDPGYAGEIWGSTGDPSVTDSLEAAASLARDRLAARAG